jgi:hypothetical protein
MPPGHSLKSLLRSLVNVEQPQLEVQDRFAGDAKPKMPGLDDAGVHRADRHLEHPLTDHRSERMERSRDARHDTVVGKILAQRPRAIRPIVVERDPRRIGMTDRDEAEEIHDLALEPVRRRILRRDRRVRGRCRIDRRKDAKKRAVARQRPEVMQDETAGRNPLIAREQRHQPSIQIRDDSIGTSRQYGGVGLERQLPGPHFTHNPIGHAEGGRHRVDRRPHTPPQTTCVAA